MNAGQKEKRAMMAGLGMMLIGGAWFGLSLAGTLGAMAGMLGYFLGAGLAFSGLLVAGIYFYRWQRIQKLLQSGEVLAKWMDGQDPVVITSTCAYVNGELHLWGLPGTRLEAVQIERKTSLGFERAYLQITIGEAAGRVRSLLPTLPGDLLWRSQAVSIRIPPGQEPAAQRVIEGLKK